MPKESAAKPFYSVLILAFVCSILVAGAAVGLRPKQEANKRIDRKINILRAAGLYLPDRSVEELFQVVETKIVHLATGDYVAESQISPQDFDQLKSARQPETSTALSRDEDKAGLRRVEEYSLVYLVHRDGEIDQVILPIRGKGLWSTMYGYVSLGGDLSTIRGITFYEHGETPGLGGEIANKSWLSGWQGKKMFDSSNTVALNVAKGKTSKTGAAAVHQVDGISGATLTGKGVNELLRFWFGEHGFRPFLDRLAHKGGQNG